MNKRLNITKEELNNLYVDLNKTTYEIASIYGCGRKVISNLLKQYGIEIKRYKRNYSFYYEQSLNDTQKQMLLGSLIGDGCIAKHHEGINSCRFIEQHSISQLGYLEWKKEILNNFISTDIRFIDNSQNKSYGNGISCSLNTVLHKEFVPFYNMFYKNGKKEIPFFELTPLSLAVWYYDDGSISRISQKGNYYSAKLHTEGYDLNSINTLRDMLKQLGINSGLANVKSKYNVITLGHKDTNKLMNIISTVQIPCMSYKIQFSDNPVETQNSNSGVSDLKCSDAKTHSSLLHSEMMV
jgi:hypothetical protein